MKKIYLLMLLNLIQFGAYRAQQFEWAKREGLWAYDYGYGITTDPSGNVYVAGKYEENADFSGTTLPCQGNHDIYVAKYSAQGDLNWITTAGGPLGDYAEGVACNGSNIFIAGEIEGYGVTVYFQNSPATLHCIGSNDIFIAKYDMSGNLLWAKSAGAYKNDKALSVTYDNSGNVFICGFFNDTATFGGSTSVYGHGENDIYIAKYDGDGNFLWVRSAGSAGRDEAKSIKCDASGNAYITGLFKGSVDFGGSTVTAPNNYYDMFLAKYDPNGNLVWVKNAGGDYDDVGWSLTLDNAGKIFVAGEFNAYALFGTIPLITTGNADVFVASYDAAGNVNWASQAGGPLIERARGIGTDGSKIYITGQFGSVANFGSHGISAADSSDIFISALSNDGNFLWAIPVDGPPDSLELLSYESGNAICADVSGNVFATGALLNGGKFGNTSYIPYSRTDVFITKISQADVSTNILESNKKEVYVYPNPAQRNFTVDLNNFPNEKVGISIYNLLGESVEAETFKLSPGKFSVDLSDAQKGIYLVEVKYNGKTIREKIILQ